MKKEVEKIPPQMTRIERPKLKAERQEVVEPYRRTFPQS
jgi:hypothetical protein